MEGYNCPVCQDWIPSGSCPTCDKYAKQHPLRCNYCGSEDGSCDSDGCSHTGKYSQNN